MPQILGASAQTCHKVLKLSLRAKEEQKKETLSEKHKFRHCKNKDILMVKRDVAKRIRLLTILKGKNTPKIYQYDVLRRIYLQAKERLIGYKKPQQNIIPLSFPVKTMQEEIQLTNARIRSGDGDTAFLINTLRIQEKQLYACWTKDRQKTLCKVVVEGRGV